MENAKRMFPMQGDGYDKGPSIPWWLAERIYKLHCDVYSNSQSLERLAERHGFGWSEVPVLCREWESKFGRAAFEKLMAEWHSAEE